MDHGDPHYGGLIRCRVTRMSKVTRPQNNFFLFFGGETSKGSNRTSDTADSEDTSKNLEISVSMSHDGQFPSGAYYCSFVPIPSEQILLQTDAMNLKRQNFHNNLYV